MGCIVTIKPWVKGRTYRPIFRVLAAESAVESADSTPKSADYTTNSVIVCRLPLSNMFDILNPLESAYGNQPTVAVDRWEIVPVGTGLYILTAGYPLVLVYTVSSLWYSS